MQISHINNIVNNTRRLVEDGVLNGEDKQIKRILQGNMNVRTRTLEKNLKGTGVTVAEIMLNDGIETEWYKEAAVSYLPQNLKRYREEWGFTKEFFADLCGMSSRLIALYEKDTVPTLRRLQSLADVLEVEVADLLLPPEGGETSETDCW